MADKPDWSAVQQSLIFSGTLNNATTGRLDVSAYNSVTVVMSSQLLNTVSALTYYFQQLDFTPVDGGLLSNDAISNHASFTLPVVGQFFALTNSIVQNTNVAIYGNTIILPKRAMGSSYPVRSFSTGIANGTPTGTFTQLLGLDAGDGFSANDASSYNGQVYVHINLSAVGGATSWQFITGHLDVTGAAGVRVIPYNANAFIVTDDERMSWPIEGMQDSGSWTLFGYNTGQYDHTVYVRFLLDLVAEPAPTAPTPVANLVGLSSDLVVPADLSTLAVT